MSEKDGGFAFPFTPTDQSGQIGPTEPGMTLRDWFAGQLFSAAMSGSIYTSALRTLSDPADGGSTKLLRLAARRSYEAADAMLAVRDEGDQS